MDKRYIIFSSILCLIVLSSSTVLSDACSSYSLGDPACTTTYTEKESKWVTVPCEESGWKYKDYCGCDPPYPGKDLIQDGCASVPGCWYHSQWGYNSGCGADYCANIWPKPTSGKKWVSVDVTKYECHYISSVSYGPCVESSLGSGVGYKYATNPVTWSSIKDTTSCSHSYAPTQGGYYWSLAGEIANACCGDDGSEFKEVEISSTDCPPGYTDGTEGCCNSNTDCFDENSCYSTGDVKGLGVPNKAYCSGSNWYGGDASGPACTAIAGANLWMLGGISPCCGDDLNELVNIEKSGTDAPPGYNDLTTACCSLITDCNYNDVCHVTGSVSAPGTPNKAYCNMSIWYGGDEGPTECTAIVGFSKWNIGGEIDPTECCTDDPSENVIVETPSTDAPSDFSSGTDGCCDLNTDCVDADTCYATTTGLGAFPQRGYCENANWYGGDYSLSACNEVAGSNLWMLGGDATSPNCCKDDLVEYVNYQNGYDNNNVLSGNISWNVDDNACCDDPLDNVGATNNCVPSSSTPIAVNTGSAGQDRFSAPYTDGTNYGWMECDYFADTWCNNLGNGSFALAGETGVGEYQAVLGVQNNGGRTDKGDNQFGYAETCGDDANEFIIETNIFGANGTFIEGPYERCCNAATDCVNATGDCVSSDTVLNADASMVCFNKVITVCNKTYYEDCHGVGSWRCNTDGVTKDKKFVDVPHLPPECCNDFYDNDCDNDEDEDDVLDCSTVNGTVYEEIAYEYVDKGYNKIRNGRYYNISRGANIKLKYADDLTDPYHEYGAEVTDFYGQFNMSINRSRAFILYASKNIDNVPLSIQFPQNKDQINLELFLGSSSDCRSDCSIQDDIGRKICRKDCDGFNGCNYDYTILGPSGEVKDICNGKQAGWIALFNSTYEVSCCNGEPYPKVIRQELKVDADNDISNILTYSKMITLNGELVTMYITTWEKE